MRLVINHQLSYKDKEALKRGNEETILSGGFDLTDFQKLKNTLNQYDQHFFECLAYLIKEKRIEIKVIRPKSGRGIAHFKLGVFRDETHSVRINGSQNLTAYGLSENLENLDVDLSWIDDRA